MSDAGAGFSWSFSRLRRNMSFRHGSPAEVLDNRRGFLFNMGADYQRLVCAEQVHGARAVKVTAADAGKGALSFESSVKSADALITDVPGLPLGILTAGCLPVLIFDPVTPAVAAIHAGWRGSRGGILGNTLRLMKDSFGTRPEDVLAELGPCIGKCCYRVSSEFSGIFPGYVSGSDGGVFFDLSGFNKEALIECGVKPRRINDSGLCTFCLKRDFFSYRRENISAGRMLSAVMLK